MQSLTKEQQIKLVSVCDTIHDFGDLKGNLYFDKFRNELSTINGVKIPTANVEDKLLDMFHMSDKDVHPYNYRTGGDVNVAMKDFFVDVQNVNDDVFKVWLGTVLLQNNETIDFVTDTTILPQEVVCDISVHNNKGRFLVNEATFYDRGTASKLKSGCVDFQHMNATLSKKNGHLTELNFISTFFAEEEEDPQNTETSAARLLSNADMERRIGIAYNYDVLGKRDYTGKVYLRKYVHKYRQADAKKLTFYKDIIKAFVLKKFKPGGKGGNSAGVLRKLLKDLQTIYRIDSTLVDQVEKGDKDSAEKLARILFDFKRAGDHLQVKSCEPAAGQVRKTTFISNDRMSVILANILKLPVIRTTTTSERQEEHRTRRLYFYNMSLGAKFTKLLNKNMSDNFAANLRRTQQFFDALDRLDLGVVEQRAMELASMKTYLDALLNTMVSAAPRIGRGAGLNLDIKNVYQCRLYWIIADYFVSGVLKLLLLKKGVLEQKQELMGLQQKHEAIVDLEDEATTVKLKELVHELERFKWWDVYFHVDGALLNGFVGSMDLSVDFGMGERLAERIMGNAPLLRFLRGLPVLLDFTNSFTSKTVPANIYYAQNMFPFIVPNVVQTKVVGIMQRVDRTHLLYRDVLTAFMHPLILNVLDGGLPYDIQLDGGVGTMRTVQPAIVPTSGVPVQPKSRIAKAPPLPPLQERSPLREMRPRQTTVVRATKQESVAVAPGIRFAKKTVGQILLQEYGVVQYLHRMWTSKACAKLLVKAIRAQKDDIDIPEIGTVSAEELHDPLVEVILTFFALTDPTIPDLMYRSEHA
jgi:hypothetical protein